MLKTDLHLHCNGDPEDVFIKYSAKELIDHAASLKFDVIAITCHNKVLYSDGLQEYANSRNILLIPGVEAYIENRHVLLFNFTQEEVNKVKNFNDLRKIKEDKHLVIAPHPYYVNLNPFDLRQISLFSKLEKNIDVFDAIEFCNLYSRHFNRANKKANKIAKENNISLVGNSDLHRLKYMGTNFSLVDSNNNVNSVIKAIKNGKVELSSRPRTAFEVSEILYFFFMCNMKKKLFYR